MGEEGLPSTHGPTWAIAEIPWDIIQQSNTNQTHGAPAAKAWVADGAGPMHMTTKTNKPMVAMDTFSSLIPLKYLGTDIFMMAWLGTKRRRRQPQQRERVIACATENGQQKREHKTKEVYEGCPSCRSSRPDTAPRLRSPIPSAIASVAIQSLHSSLKL